MQAEPELMLRQWAWVAAGGDRRKAERSLSVLKVAGELRDGRGLCFAPALGAPALEGPRMSRNMWTWFQGLWREPSDWRSPDGEPLERIERAQYDRLEESGTGLPTKLARFEIDPKWLPVGARMASTHDDPECPVRISYSLPSFVDPYMFIDVGSTCGSLCGSGELRIYRWTGKHWLLVARRQSWLA
ncbi:hypothetical protein [Sphingobium fontiphilum]|uniref:hypothetical protein n=1 Tax=Sphingobium fontiphilum TaxID=944425 RepID=UPI00161F877F|nr:hypothetical protein [Sphingobium fontiphilum]